MREGAAAYDAGGIQTAWIDALTEQGYAAQICVGFEEVKETIEQYMRLPKPEEG